MSLSTLLAKWDEAAKLGASAENAARDAYWEAVRVKMGVESDNNCKLIGDNKAEHWDCDMYRDGTVTDLRTGERVGK